MKEVALIHSEGILAGEMKHGPLALVDETIPAIVMATKDNMYKKMQSVVQQLCARSARLIVICNEGDHNIKEYATKEAMFIEVGLSLSLPVLSCSPIVCFWEDKDRVF